MKTVGILGAGQLGCMLASSLQKLGATVRFLDPDAHAPGRALTPYFTNASWTDPEALRLFFASCDIVTYEFENVDVRHLDAARAASGTPLVPSARVLSTTQSRADEKSFLASAKLPCAPFLVVSTREELIAACARVDVFPFVAKTLRGGYDGKGQATAQSAADLPKVEALLPCILEEAVPLALEVSVVTARDALGRVRSFPPFENIHARHILDVTLFPAPSLTNEVAARLVTVAQECARALDVVGLLTTEFFLSRSASRCAFAGGAGLSPVGDFHFGVNEFAPRPHNSGHVTRQACFVSQFDALARILLGLPVPPLVPVSPGVFAMGNLLGDTWLAQSHARGDLPADAREAPGSGLALDAAWNAFPDVLDVTLYGKEVARAGRKMGHFTLRAPSAEAAIARSAAFREALERG